MDKFYVIILDGDSNDPNFWVYVAQSNDLNEIRKVKQYIYKKAKSKADYEGDPGEDTSVQHAITGSTASGKIYMLTSK